MRFTHPLHDIDFFSNQILEKGYADLDRCTGRTTVLALRAIADAMESPRTPISVVDHYGSHQSNRHAVDMTMSIAHSAGLYRILRHTDGKIIFGEPMPLPEPIQP